MTGLKKVKKYDVLIVDDDGKWLSLIKDPFEGTYCCDIADSFEEAKKKISLYRYKIICSNWDISGSINGRKLMLLMKNNYRKLPVILITGNPALRAGDTERIKKRIQERYPNVKNIIFKNAESENFIDDLEYAVSKAIQVSILTKIFRHVMRASQNILPIFWRDRADNLKINHRDNINHSTENNMINQEGHSTPGKLKVFISYAQEDHDIACRIYNDIKNEGITAWIDQKDLFVGQDWRETIPHIIRDSTYFLLIISKYSVSKKGYIQKEQKIALEMLDEFPVDRIFIIPAKIDSTEPIDEKLRNLYWADLSDYEEGLQQILKVLKSEHPSFIKQSKNCFTVDPTDNTNINEEKTLVIVEKTKQEIDFLIEIKKIIPVDTQVDTMDGFVSWFEDQLDSNFDDLITLGGLLIKILRMKRTKFETNPQKKTRMSSMETALKNDVQKFKGKLAMGEESADERTRLHQRINFALELIMN